MAHSKIFTIYYNKMIKLKYKPKSSSGITYAIHFSSQGSYYSYTCTD